MCLMCEQEALYFDYLDAMARNKAAAANDAGKPALTPTLRTDPAETPPAPPDAASPETAKSDTATRDPH